MIKRAVSDNEIMNCFDVMFELRSHLEKEKFLRIIRSMESEGYKLIFLESENKVVAVAGYRVYLNLLMGKHLYVDDLVTSRDFRSKGYGEEMIKWLRNIAKKSDCKFYHLDSGTYRGSAHKFYFQQGFTIASFHFSEELKDS